MRVRFCGFQHHFIGECRFHLATFIGPWLISTIGDYRDPEGTQRRIGLGESYYETYVFRTDDADDPETGHPRVADWSEVWGQRHESDFEANRCHVVVAGWIKEGLTPNEFPEWDKEGKT